MSIQREQTKRILARVAHDLYSSGQKPTLLTVLTRVQEYFDENPAGLPLDMPDIANADSRSSHERYNEMVDNTSENLDVLYTVLLQYVSDIMEINNSLQTSLNALTRRRSKLERRIDDFLLGLRNADGYFYAASDSFDDLDLVDLSLTTAEIDTETGTATIPSNAAHTTKVKPDTFRSPQITIEAEDGTDSYQEISSLYGAVEDTRSNLMWAFEVVVSEEQEVIATVDIPLRDQNDDNPRISTIKLTPYTMEPVQLITFVGSNRNNLEEFGGRIQTGTHQMVFEDDVRQAGVLRLQFRKTDYDYFDHNNGQTRYHYIFGAQSLTLTQQSYARSATLLSQPHSIPDDLSESMVIDAVSLTVDDHQSDDTSIDYFVAAAPNDGISDLSEPVWHRIRPIGSRHDDDRIVRFNGLSQRTRAIVENPQSDELRKIPLQDTGPASERNPTNSIIPAVDVYRIAKFDENFVTSNIVLLEGRNSTRIYSTAWNENAIADLSFWKDEIDNGNPALDFGRIDTGDGFFYGGDVGVGGRSVYAETFLHSPARRETIMSNIHKVDDRSQHWDVKVFLNGQQIAHLPSGQNRQQAPWAFMRGKNHIIVLAQIPDEETAPDSYTGRLDLMENQTLTDFGEVYLAQWNYVDFFDMQYNESSTKPPKTFTVYEGEVISRRRPSTNLFLRYGTPTRSEPDAILLRADMSRSRNNPSVSPRLNQYRLRFSYD